MTLAREMETDIDRLQNTTIIQFLKSHLNKNAVCPCELFDSEKQCTHDAEKPNLHQFSPLSCFFTFTSEPLAAELLAHLKTLKEEEAAAMIATACKPSSHKTGFCNFYNDAGNSLRLALSEWVLSWSEQNILTIFKDEYADRIRYSIYDLLFLNEIAGKNLYGALMKLKPDDLLDLFKEQRPASEWTGLGWVGFWYSGLIRLIDYGLTKSSKNEPIIFSLLGLLENLLQQLPDKDRSKLLCFGKAEYLHLLQVLKGCSDAIISKALDIVMLLPPDKVEAILSSPEDYKRDPYWASLLLSQSLHYFLHNSPNANVYSSYNMTSFTRAIQSNPAVMGVLWGGENALIHVAVKKKKTKYLEVLLENGTDPNVRNYEGLTPLDMAIRNQDIESLILLILHKKTKLISHSADLAIHLSYPIHTLPYPIVKTVLDAVGKNHTTEEVALFFAAMLPHLSLSISIRGALQEHLGKQLKTNGVGEQLTLYCNDEEDAAALCLLHAAQWLSLSKERFVMRALSDFIRKELTIFHKNDPKGSPLEKDAAQNALLLFLFSLQASDMCALLNGIGLNQEEWMLLQPLFCHALVQPLVFSHCTSADYQLFQKGLHLQESSLRRIASNHLTNANLALLPPELLQEHAKKLTEDELFHINQNRMNGCLLVLSLNKELSCENRNEDRIKILCFALDKELEHFHHGAGRLDLNELRTPLQLAIHPHIKGLIGNFFQKNVSGSSIHKAAISLFRSLDEKPVLENSLLYEWFSSLAASPLLMGEIENQPGFRAWFSELSIDESKEIMRLQLQALRPRLRVDAFPHQASISRWLHQLKRRALTLELNALALALTAIRDELVDFSTSLENLPFNPLQKSLWKLEDRCDEVRKALLACPVADNPSAQKALFDEAGELLHNDCFAAVSNLEKDHVLLTREKNEAFTVNLRTLLEEKMGIDFFRKLQDLRLALEDRQRTCEQEYEQVWLSHKELIGLRPLFQEGAEPCNMALLAEKASEHAISFRKNMLVLFKGLNHAILAREDREALQASWRVWQQGCRHLFPIDVFLKELVHGITALTTDALDLIIEEEDKLLASQEALEPFIEQLRAQTSWHQLLECLMSAKQELLLEFSQLTVALGLEDLHNLIDYAIEGTKHSWTSSQLSKVAPPAEWEEIQSWLGASFMAIDKAMSTSLSVKALIAGYYRNSNTQLDGLTHFIRLLKTHNKNPIPYQAMVLIVSSYQSIFNEDLLSPLASKCVQGLALWMRDASIELQDELLLQLDDSLIQQLVEHCLSGVSSDNPERASLCKTLLLSLCRGDNEMRNGQMQLIKEQLGRQNLHLLTDKALIKFGNEILAERPAAKMQENVYQGVWIQWLLLSPRFIAALPLEKWHILIERYRALSLLLKKDEFTSLNQALSAKLHAFDWQNELFKDEAFQKHCKAKRKRLLMFRADDSIRALLIQLEENCLALKDSDPTLAKAALDNLYAYYNQELKGMQGTFLFRMADYIYTQAVHNKGDLCKNYLRSWIEKKVPHYNFVQRELVRKQVRMIYDEAGKKIGYLDELNYAFTLEKHIPLLDAGFAERQVLYGKKRQRVGTLTSNGQCSHDNIFQSKSSALLVGSMDIEELGFSPYALDLLFEDIFHECSLRDLFEKTEPNSQKNRWLQEQILRRLAAKKGLLTKNLIEDVATFLDIDGLLSLLQNSANSDNASQLFHAILLQDDKRQGLFSAANSLELATFFRHVSPVKTLADFLQRYCHAPWFHQGLLLFTPIPKPNVLSHALDRLALDVQEKRMAEEHFDSIIQKLIGEEETARLVWNGFLSEPSNVELFCPHVSKTPLLTVVLKLNVKKQTPQYQLVLSVLGADSERLFQDLEPIASKRSWSADEVKILSFFINAHVRKNPQCPIGQNMLAKWVFRCAHFGLTTLFYKKPKPDSQKPPALIPSIVTTSLKRSLLDSFVARFYVLRSLKHMTTSLSDSIKTVLQWFKGSQREALAQKKLLQDLQANHGLRDWKKMAETSWKEVDCTSLPILSAFLLNYSGDIEVLGHFLDDILQNNALVQPETGILHNMSTFMAHYPKRDVSLVIFKALEKSLVRNHLLMDKKLFIDMAAFYAGKNAVMVGSVEEKLLQRFGQQKWYVLTKHSADLMLQPRSKWQSFIRFFTSRSDKEKTIKKVGNEAHVEAILQPHVNDYFFEVRKFFVRCWHGTRTKRTQLVKLCEDMSAYDSGDKKITKVVAPDLYCEERVEPLATKTLATSPKPSETGMYAKSMVPKAQEKMNLNPGGLVPDFETATP